MKHYDGGIIIMIFALFAFASIGLISYAREHGIIPIHSTYVGVNGGISASK